MMHAQVSTSSNPVSAPSVQSRADDPRARHVGRARIGAEHTAGVNLPPCRDRDPPEWDILSIHSADVVCEERLGGVVTSFVRRVA